MSTPKLLRSLDQLKIKHGKHSGPSGTASCVRCICEVPQENNARIEFLKLTYSKSAEFGTLEALDFSLKLQTLITPLYFDTEQRLLLQPIRELCDDLVSANPAQMLCNFLSASLVPAFIKAPLPGIQYATYHSIWVIKIICILLHTQYGERFTSLTMALNQNKFIPMICELIQTDERAPLQAVAVTALRLLIEDNPTYVAERLSIDNKHRLLIALSKFAHIDVPKLQDDLMQPENTWQLETWGFDKIPKSKVPLEIASCMGEVAEHALLILYLMLHRWHEIASRQETLKLLRKPHTTELISSLLDIMMEKVCYGPYPQTRDYSQASALIFLLTSIPQYPCTPFFEKSPAEQREWDASMEATRIVAKTPEYLSKLKRAFTRRLKLTTHEMEQVFSRGNCKPDNSGIPFIEQQKTIGISFLAEIFRLVINVTYQAESDKEPIYEVLSWLSLAYSCLKPPKKGDDEMLLAANWDLFTSRAAFTNKGFFNPFGQPCTYIPSMRVLAPLLCLRILNWLLQPNRYHLLSTVTDEQLSNTPGFSLLSKSELVNVKRMITQPYLRAVFIKGASVMDKLHDECGSNSMTDYPVERAHKRLGVIELESALIKVKASVDKLNVSWTVIAEPLFLELKHYEFLLLYATNEHASSLYKYDKCGGGNRYQRIIETVIKKVKPIYSSNPLIETQLEVVTGLIKRVQTALAQDALDEAEREMRYKVGVP